MGEKKAYHKQYESIEITRPELHSDDWIQIQSNVLFTKLQGTWDIHQYGEILLEQIANITEANAGAFYTLKIPDNSGEHPDNDALIVANTFGIIEKNIKAEICKTDPLSGKSFLTKRSSYFENISINENLEQTRLGPIRTVNIAIIPIIHNSSLIAMIEIYCHEPFNIFKRQFLEVVSKNLGQGVRGILDQLYNQKILKELAESHSQLESQKKALDSAAIVAETDPKGRITYVNDKFLTLSKYSPEELIGKDHRVINSHHHPKEFFTHLWKTISSGMVWHGEIKNRAKDGSYYWVDTTIYPLKNTDGKIIKYIAIRFEITDKKDAFEKLQIANDATKKAADAKSAFLANMSHEIRTPLNSIIGLTEVLKETNLSQEQSMHLNTIEYASKSLLNIVNDILDLSKLNAGQVQCETRIFSIKTLARETLSMISSQARSKGIGTAFSIDDNISEHYIGDEFRINQVLINLLGNSVKFTDEGVIELKITQNTNPEHPGNLLFTIKDTGVGIPNEAQSLLFQAFQQGDNSISKKFGGTGLGLFICKKLVNLMGGNIWFESIPNHGSTFYFTLSLPPTNTPVNSNIIHPLPSPLPQLANPIKILLVDDSKENRDLIKLYLKNQNCLVCEAENGHSAIEIFKKEVFSLVLMDLQMPIIDGFECTKIMRTIEKDLSLKRTPIIALTACALEEEIKKTKEVGCDDHSTKPISKKALLSLIRKSMWL